MKPVHFQLIIIAALLAACSTVPTTTAIVASEGGTITTNTHDIVIPPSSLATDTEVTLGMSDTSGYPAVPGDRSVVLALEPEGTVLELAATVTIHGTEIGASAEETVAVFQLVDGGWSPREFSRDIETGDITTSVSFFSPIGVGISAAAAGGTIQGTILWGDGTAVGGATIELYQGDSLVQSTMSSTEGLYRFEGLESGSYAIRVNFECVIDQGVSVSAGATVTQDLTLCGAG